MTKMTKRLVVCAVAVAFVWPAIVSAHGQKESPASASAAQGTTTITYLAPGLSQPSTKREDEAIVTAFEASHPTIKVKLVGVAWNNAYTKVVNEVEAGNAQDVIYMGAREVPAFVGMRGLMDLDQFGIGQKMNQYREGVRDLTKYRGKYYAIPYSLSTKALIYRTDLIKNPPKTWNQIVSVAQEVMAKHPGVYGYAMSGAKHVSTTSQYFNFLFQAGGRVFDSNGNVAIDSPAGIKALTFYADLYRKYHLTPNPIQYNREQLPQLFKAGKIAMFVDGPWVKGALGVPPDNKQVPYAAAALPSEKAGVHSATILVADAVGLYAKTAHPKAAWTFLDWMTSFKQQTTHDAQGMVPMQIREESLPQFNNSAYFTTYVGMVKYGVPQPHATAWEPFQNIIVNAVQRAITGDATPAEALAHAAQQIRQQKLNPGA